MIKQPQAEQGWQKEVPGNVAYAFVAATVIFAGPNLQAMTFFLGSISRWSSGDWGVDAGQRAHQVDEYRHGIQNGGPCGRSL